MRTDAFIDSAFKIDYYEPSHTTQNIQKPQMSPLPTRCIQHNKKMRFICFREEKAICDYCVTNCSENAHRLVSLKLTKAQAKDKALQLRKAKEHYLVVFNKEIENEKMFLSGIIDNEYRIDIKRELKNAIDKYIKAKLDVINDLQIDESIRILEDGQVNKEFFKAFDAEIAFDEDYIVNIFPIWAHKGEKHYRVDDLDPLAQDLIEVKESWKVLRQVLDTPLGKFPAAGGLDASSIDFNNTFQESQISPKIKKGEDMDSTIIQKNIDDDLDDSLSLFPEVELCKEHKKELHFVCPMEGKTSCVDCVITCNQQGHQILPLGQVRDQAKQMVISCKDIKDQYHQKWNQLLKNANIDQKIDSPIIEEKKHEIEEEKSKIPKTRENYQDQMIKMIIKISQGYLKLDSTIKKLETGNIDHAFLEYLNGEIKTEAEHDFEKLVLLCEYAKKILNFDTNFKGSVSDWLIALKEPGDLSIDPHFEVLIDLHEFLCSVNYRASHQLPIVVNKSLNSESNSAIEPGIIVKCDIASRVTIENQLQITLGSLGFSLKDYPDKNLNQPNWQYFRKCQFEYDWNFERKDQKSNERWRIVRTALEALLSCSNRTLQLIIECDLSESLPVDGLTKTKSEEENKNDDLPKESINAKKLSEGHFFLLDEQYFSRHGLYDIRNLRQLALYFRKISRKNLMALSNTVVQPTLCLDSFLLSISSTEMQYDEFANLWHTGLLASIETRKEFELIIEENIKRPLKILDGLLDYALPIVSKCQTIKLRLNSVVSATEDIEELIMKALAFEIYFLMTREHYMRYKITQHAPLFAEKIASELGLKSDWFVSFDGAKFEKSFYGNKYNNPMLRDKTIDSTRKIIQDDKWGIRDYLIKVYDPEVINWFEENLQMRPDAGSIEFSIPIDVTMQRIDLTKKASAEIVVGNGIAIKGLIES